MDDDGFGADEFSRDCGDDHEVDIGIGSDDERDNNFGYKVSLGKVNQKAGAGVMFDDEDLFGDETEQKKIRSNRSKMLLDELELGGDDEDADADGCKYGGVDDTNNSMR